MIAALLVTGALLFTAVLVPVLWVLAVIESLADQWSEA